MVNEIKTDIKKFAKVLFDKKSDAKLIASFDILNIRDESEGLFEALSMLLLEGLKLYCSDENNIVDLENILLDDFLFIKKCFTKIKINLNFSVNKNLENEDSKELKGYKMKLDVNDNLYYEIMFDFIT